MQAIVRRTRIDIEGASDVPEGTWIRLLDELKAVRMPGLTPPGKRMMLAINQSGRMDAFIYRTGLTDEEVICILAKYGIEAHTWVI